MGLSKTSRLKRLLHSGQTEFLLEAHNGISARIVEQAGFSGIWASGLALSAQFGVRDSNEASWTQIVEMLEFMSDVTAVPILLDGDTGYGNFNNMRRLVRKLEQRDIAGVCIEDKLFPKTNSFIQGRQQLLANIDEFCGKIKAGKDSQSDPDFCLIARVEALVAGWGLAEALKRAEHYHAAGADGILIHSTAPQADEILTFAKEWAHRSPLLIVPTRYYSTPTEVFQRAQISLVIWANYMIRAAIANMQRISTEIMQAKSVSDIEDRIASVNDVFSLQGADELRAAEERYLHTKKVKTCAIILAASRGDALQSLTKDRPKVMLPIGGKTILQRLLDQFKKQAIHQLTLVAGYKAEAIEENGIDIIVNKQYATTNELASLQAAAAAFTDDMLIIYGDLLIRDYILRDLLAMNEEIIIVVDSAIQRPHHGGSLDYAYCDQQDERSLFQQDVHLQQIASTEYIGKHPASGRWIGMLRINGKGHIWLARALEELSKRADFSGLDIPDLLNQLVQQGHAIKVHYIHGHWLDVNSIEDLDSATRFISD